MAAEYRVLPLHTLFSFKPTLRKLYNNQRSDCNETWSRYRKCGPIIISSNYDLGLTLANLRQDKSWSLRLLYGKNEIICFSETTAA